MIDRCYIRLPLHTLSRLISGNPRHPKLYLWIYTHSGGGGGARVWIYVCHGLYFRLLSTVFEQFKGQSVAHQVMRLRQTNSVEGHWTKQMWFSGAVMNVLFMLVVVVVKSEESAMSECLLKVCVSVEGGLF